jgi:exonuclease SbcC
MGAEALFLERIAISNFRAYSPEFELALPRGPGVTVLSGPNGLGKTSLFEAIEWALTGDVRRLSTFTRNKLDQRYLLRRGSGDSCEVSAVFTGDVHVRRLLTVGKTVTVVGTEAEEVAAILRVADSRWRVTGENLAEYLHLTHFHPQAAELRLVSGKPGQRWLRISPLAGAERFDRFRANLRNARAGLTRIISDREKAVEAAKEREQSWTRRTAQLNTLSAVDRAVHGALSPREAAEKLLVIARLIPWEPPRGNVTASSDVANYLAEVKISLEQAITAAKSDENRLRGLGELPSSWTSANASRGSALERQANARTQVQEAETRAADSDRVAKQRAAELAVATSAATDVEQRHRLAASIQLQEGELGRVVDQLAALAAQQPQLLVAADARTAEVQRYVATQQQLQTDNAARKALEDSIRDIQAALLRLAESNDLEPQVEAQRQRLASKATQLESLRAASAAVDIELRTAKAQRAAAVSRLDAEASRLGELSQAVATIAAHLTEHDETCPVCKTDFGEGELRERALRQAVGSSAAMATSRQDLETAERNVLYLESRGQELSGQIRSAEQEIASLTAISTQLTTRIALLRSDPRLSPLGGADERLNSLIRATEEQVRAISSRIESAPKEHELLQALSRARQASTEATRDLDANRAQTAKMTTQRSELVAKIEHARQALELSSDIDAGNVTLRLSQELASAEGRRVATAELLNAAKAAHDVDVQELETRRQALTVATAELSRVDGELSAMRTRWTQAALRDDPSESLLQGAILLNASRQAALEEALPRLVDTAAGLEEWQRLDTTRTLEADLTAEAQGRAVEEYGRVLSTAVANAEQQLQAASEAYQASENLSNAVRDIGEDFGVTAIAPFAEVFKGFLRALVRDARFQRVSPEYGRVQGGGNVLRFNLELGEQASKDFQVEMVLSEGQLSEVSLAAMLAASCIYPWSRWRGVLLDDPTQYQDLTHSTSLFEVVRNLASDAGFQVVVAVHDRAQADFLVRKLQSARVPYVECEYLAIGPHGAVTRQTGTEAVNPAAT